MFLFLKPALSFLKKAFLVVAVYFIVISLFFHFIGKDKISLSSTQIDPIKKNRTEIYKIINDKELNKTKEGKLTIALYRRAICGMIGEACTNNPEDGDKNFDKSTFGFFTKIVIFPFTNMPASGVGWVYSGLQNAGFVPKTMAAEGIGFAAIKPFSNLWKIFRDLSYMILVIVLIAIGFMIMFRTKINPQTVISVENALPKIVIALILITFSFAIAGFLIDLMYVLIVLIISVLSGGGNNFNSTQFQNEYIGAGFGKLFFDVTAGHVWYGRLGIMPVMSNALLGLFPWYLSLGVKTIVGAIFAVFINNAVLNPGVTKDVTEAANSVTAATFGVGNLIGGILHPGANALVLFVLFLFGMTTFFNFIMSVILTGTLVLLVFRIFALLFSSYLKLLLLVIIGPFLLMFEAIPGKNVFSTWIKGIIGNLIAFPITITIFILGYIIINSTVPAGYSDLRLPYLGSIESGAFKILIGVGLMILIPDLVKMTKEVLGIKDLPISIGLGTFFGGAAAVGGAAMGGIGQFGSLSLAVGAFGEHGVLGKTGIGKTVGGWLGINTGTTGLTKDKKPVDGG